jgi:anthraniloyl-CoA monooxygenase
MKIVCIGGGPAGLYFGLLMKMRDPRHDVTVVERNKPYDTFGWGVVFSDQTMDNMRREDPVTAAAVADAFNHWDDIELEFKGERIRSGGHGFVGIGRKKLLNILQARCEELGVRLVFESEVDSDLDFPDADLVVASDGINSRIRSRYAEIFRPDIVVRPNRYIWLGTHKLYDAFTFVFEKTEHGWFQAHIYKFDADTSTFIVECPEHVWLAHGLDRADQDASIAFCERVFARHLDGARLMTNARHLRGSAWLNFQRVTCARWHHFNGRSHVVLMGDAVHTAHFAIGSGTKLAIEDAIELARLFAGTGPAPDRADIADILDRWQESRRIDVLRLQNAAWNAMEWFEVCGARYCDQLEPPQFMYSMLTRSQRISHENLRLRDQGWLEGYEAWFAGRAGVAAPAGRKPPPPMFTPYRARGVTLKNRVVVSPMAQYSAEDGVVGDYHLVRAGDGRCRACLRRDDLRQPRGPDHPGLPRHLHRGAGRGVAPDRRLGARQQRRQVRDADRACGGKGIDPAGLGRHRHAAGAGQLADRLRLAAAISRRRQPDRARDDPRRDGADQGAVRRRRMRRRRDRRRLARASLRAWLSALELRLAADQSPQRRLRRRSRGTAALSAGGLRRGPCRVAGGASDLGAHLRA